ncbi:TIGR02300 family protein [Roseococcus sp. SYP-B2431]|uniref:TIGR02300 family protein n=1 Tax=Roseococcus sp. SYP-B2431 TaxID=2496640 RepID=UPI00103B9F93|nr:TIGR02300 family protein [Roseococcus sp. SYP-B2431]TCH98822.1 TIGR02300 family protein [Roseococcus sp. SYP-B2431]
MAKPELGLKRTCVACSAKFYDMGKQPAACPKCGTEQPAEQPRPRRSANIVPDEKLKKRPAAAAEADGDDVELEDVEADAVEDADELEDEDEAIADEIEVETDREEEG